MSDRPVSKTTAAWPKAGQVWRSNDWAVRHVRGVDDDGYSVTYSRPAPAHPDWRTVLMRDWLLWVQVTNAVCRKKATNACQDKDWGYTT